MIFTQPQKIVNYVIRLSCMRGSEGMPAPQLCSY